jgi:hypothetical protein
LNALVSGAALAQQRARNNTGSVADCKLGESRRAEALAVGEKRSDTRRLHINVCELRKALHFGWDRPGESRVGVETKRPQPGELPD